MRAPLFEVGLHADRRGVRRVEGRYPGAYERQLRAQEGPWAQVGAGELKWGTWSLRAHRSDSNFEIVDSTFRSPGSRSGGSIMPPYRPIQSLAATPGVLDHLRE